jgi:hypothetical protein
MITCRAATPSNNTLAQLGAHSSTGQEGRKSGHVPEVWQERPLADALQCNSLKTVLGMIRAAAEARDRRPAPGEASAVAVKM